MSRLLSVLSLLITSILASAQKPKLITPTGHIHSILSVAFSPDGQYVVSGSVDNTVKLWQVSTGRLLHTFEGHTNWVKAVVFSANGQKIISGDVDGQIHIWEVKSIKHFPDVICSVEETNSSGIPSTLYHFSGRDLAFLSNNSSLEIWRISTCKPIHFFEESNAGVTSLALSADDRYAVSGSDDGTLKLWNVSTRVSIRTFKSHTNRINSVIFSPDGQYIAASGDDNTLRLWQVSTGKLIYNVKNQTSEISSIKFTSDGKQIICGLDDGTLRCLQVSTGRFTRFFEGHNAGVTSLALSADDRYAVSGSDDGTLKLWNVSTRVSIRTFKSHTNRINSVIFSPDGQYIAASGDDSFYIGNSTKYNSIKLWQVSTGKLIRSFIGQADPITNLVFSPDGKSILSGYNDKTLKLWDVSTGKLIRIFKGHDFVISTVCFSNDGLYVISGSCDKSVKLWKISTGKLVRTFKGHTQWINAVASTEDNKHLVSVSDTSLKLWRVSDGKLINSFQRKDGEFELASIAPGGKQLVSLSKDNQLQIFDVNTGKPIQNLDGDSLAEIITCLIFSPDSQYVVAGSKDGNLGLWHISSGKLIYKFKSHSDEVLSAAFSQDNNFIISGSVDNTMKLWKVENGQELATFIAIDSSDYLIQNPVQYFKGSHNAIKLLHYVTSDLKTISFEQLDARYNRPDLVLQGIGRSDTSLIRAYYQAYLKRIKRLTIDTTTFQDSFAVPQVDIVNRNLINTDQTRNQLTLQVACQDSTYLLDRFHIWINEVPLFGNKGISLKKKNKHLLDTTLTVTLSQGINSIETSVINSNGIESYRIPLVVNYIPVKPVKPKLYFVGIGIDHFKDNTHNLSWSVQDIRKLSAALKQKYKDNILIDTLFDQQVTVGSIKNLKKRLLHSTINDKVIVAYSGHGLLSKDYDYFLSTYDTDFEKPQEGALPYDVLESLLDSIPARQKLMLLDACHSGEVDKEEMARYKQVQDQLNKNGIKGTRLVNTDSSRVGMKNSFELMQELFVNVGRSTGATIISAASGNQFALERSSLQNGVFTYSILEYMQDHPSCKVSELRQYVNQRVSELTSGMQVPTTRSETLNYDWNI